MRKFFVLFVFVCGLCTLYAATYKGQREFTRQCVECHTSGQAFVSQKTSFDWEMILENKGQQLVAFHLESEEAQESLEYFESSRYKKNLKHLRDFLLEYAKDSGNVPACN